MIEKAKQVVARPPEKVLSLLQEVGVGDHDLAWKVHTITAAARELSYRFDRYKSKKEDEPPGLKNLGFAVTADEEEFEYDDEDGADEAAPEASGYETFDTFDPERPVDPDTRTN